jgi:hypothetical protein
MTTVATKKNDRGLISHDRPANCSRPSTFDSTQLMTPYWVSNSHCQTVNDASTGIAHASSSPTWRIRRVALESWVISTAMATPMAIVSAAFTRQNRIDLPTTCQRYGSVTNAM